jgi:hypothetical protein
MLGPQKYEIWQHIDITPLMIVRKWGDGVVFGWFLTIKSSNFEY